LFVEALFVEALFVEALFVEALLVEELFAEELSPHWSSSAGRFLRQKRRTPSIAAARPARNVSWPAMVASGSG
jgi:hypothetical protein